MANDNHNNNNNPKVKMGIWRALAVLNIIIGIFFILLTIATLIVFMYDWVDWICLGICSGVFSISSASMTLTRSFRLKSVAISAAVVSVLLVGFYGYFLIIHDQTYYCAFDYNVTHDNLYSEKPEDIEALCHWRLITDITFVVLGLIVTIINVLFSVNAKRIMFVRIVRYPVVANVYPTQTAYQVPVNNYPQQQTGVYQIQPGYPTGQPGYPTGQPGYPTGQPGYPTGQPGYPTDQFGYPTAQQEQPTQKDSPPSTTKF